MEIRKLKAWQNTTPECNVPGGLVGQDGRMYNIFDFNAKDYANINVVATALARTNRYVGNSAMTTAQHCVRGAEALILIGHIDRAYDFLFHDAAEAMIGDFSSPIKKLISDIIGPIEIELEQKLSAVHGFKYPFDPIIKMIDVNLAQDEMMLMRHDHNYEFDYWDQKKAYDQFLLMYKRLGDYTQYSNRDFVNSKPVTTETQAK